MRGWVVFVIACFVILLSTPGRCFASDNTGERKIERFAVVMGVNDPESTDQQKLRYADDDALAMHQLLRDADVNSRLLVTFDPETKRLHPSLSPSGPPTLVGLLRELAEIEKSIKRSKQDGALTELLFFYSGHGDVEKGEGYVVIPGGRLTRTLLFSSVINRSEADRIHIIVDACKSYFLVFGKGPGGKRTPYPYPFAEEALSFDFNRVGFVLSASSGRDSHEWERYQAGIFSHEVRSAFRGGADADGDGRITYAELGAFLTVANEGIVNQRFRPQFLVHPPGKPPGDLAQPILAWPRTPPPFSVDVPNLGHFYVENALGIRVLDAHAQSGHEARLHLPHQRPLFVRRADEKIEYVLSTPNATTLSTLRRQPAQIASKGALHLAFEKLFDTPFGAAQVAAFETEYAHHPGPSLVSPVTRRDARSARKKARYAAMGTACGSATVGLAMTLWAVERYQATKTASQLDIPKINRSIRTLNTTAVVFYSVAGTAAVTYLFLKLWPDKRRSGLSVVPVATPEQLTLTFSGSLPF